MKIYNPIGSKERFLEIFQGVNKVQLNEVATNVMQSGTQLVEKAFEELKNKQSNVKQTNTQTVNDDNFVEIITNDNEGNEIIFRFKVSSTEGDQEGVFDVNNAALVNFKIQSQTLNVDMPENMKAVQEFNQNHAGEIMDVVSEYSDFETDTVSVDDEIYEEAIKLIDKVPYKKGTEQMQTSKAYADQKPTNASLRVKSNELNKFVSEGEEEFIPHGSYTVSNTGGYEIMINDAGDAARVRDAYGSDNPQTSDWLEIEYIPNDETGESEPVIDPNGYNIPLNQVMRLQEEVSEDANSILHYSQAARDSGMLYPQAKSMGVTNQYILKDALSDIGVNIVNIVDIGDNYQITFEYNGKTQSAKLKKNYGSAAKVRDQIKKKLGLTETEEYFDDEYTQDTEEEDIMALPPDYSAADLPKDDTDDDTIGVDPYDQIELGGEEASPEEQAIYSQAYDNLTATGNQAPTISQIEMEVLKLKREKGLAEPFKKNRAIPIEAEPFYEQKHVVSDMDADTVMAQSYDKVLTPELKQKIISVADEILTAHLGVMKFQMTREEYIKRVRELAINLFQKHSVTGNIVGGLNEEDKEKGEYPDPIGKKFKPKNQMPKKKRKPQSVVKLNEESEIPQEYWGNPEDEMNEEKLPEPAIEPDFDAMGMGQDDGMSLEPQGDEIEQLSQEKEETGDMLAGGLADDKVAGEFDPEQLAMGLKVEMEHTDNPMVALEIAMDHLMEIPDYYTHLDKMEKEAGVEEPEGEENELEDELLGYKPHNVSDYTSEEFDYAAAERDYYDKEDMRQHPEDYEGGEKEKEDIFKKMGDIFRPEVNEDEGFEEYQGEIGDRYQDANNNQFTVRDKVKGGVTLQGQGGEKEIATRDIGFLKKLTEATNKYVVVYDGTSAYVEDENNVPDGVEVLGRYDNIDDAQAFADKYNDSVYAITEEQIKMARRALNKRGLNEGMTKKEAVQILIRHNVNKMK